MAPLSLLMLCSSQVTGPDRKDAKNGIPASSARTIRTSSLRCARYRANALRCSKTLPAFLSLAQDALLFGPCHRSLTWLRFATAS